MFQFPPALETVRKDHFIQRRLCDDLEQLADGLPSLPRSERIQALCGRIAAVTADHFERAEAAFAALPKPRRPTDGALASLRQMHQLDEAHGQDLISVLSDQPLRVDEHMVGQLAYMLRCFFDGCRRAIALKESWIANAGGSRISPG